MRNYEDILDTKSRDEWIALIGQWIFNEDDRKMIQLYLLDGKRISEIAEEFNLSVVQTQARLAKSRNKLFKHI